MHYGLTDYSIKTLLAYGLSLLLLKISRAGIVNQSAELNSENAEQEKESFETALVVSDGNNRKTVIVIQDILYFSANSPYVNIHQLSKKYLHSATLKSLQSRLDNNQFIRIHKTYIVNIEKVVGYHSRLNGDYDLTLIDGTMLRVSRNYAATFKSSFENSHRLITK
ncbi:hypothetical protein GCM10023313_05930 [Mucilaginibacter defluvii]|uniref:HTH LytTR-type domain-containing protein n=1 Tax=Mucilaginibacter defluvii TaxID=1196019 RepID=A0ABP9FL08_9SPHI